MSDLVDLRSDTVTHPSEEMRRAMGAAEVGDDVLGDDPTVNRLQDLAAERFGREAALFTPSGVMANVIGLRTWGAPATEAIIEADAHMVNYEDGAGALFAGVQWRTIATDDGLLAPDVVDTSIRPDAYHLTPTSLVAVEQSHNRKGGTVYPLAELERIADVVQQHGIRLYMDGARVFNAAAAAHVDVAVYGALVDGLMFSLSKGLGAPVGSVIVGDADDIAVARRWRRRLGGAMRQAGVVAAAGIHALQHNVDRLAEDHANARAMAETIAEADPRAVDLAQVQTNMIYVGTGDVDAEDLAAQLGDDGILVIAFDASTIRLVTHLDVDEKGCRRAAEAIARALA
ncbi:MAG: aminotransferase class I/II-fold pyridoxal phosphate-dependent enzyme [Actinobacteria bacterium]|nr:aminotransferase class I/II-fold pyridoxal phosphate-dependent enzyme [Actinomycetota bacterium]